MKGKKLTWGPNNTRCIIWAHYCHLGSCAVPVVLAVGLGIVTGLPTHDRLWVQVGGVQVQVGELQPQTSVATA